MVSDQQVRRLFKSVLTEKDLGIAAIKASMDEKTARKYRMLGKLPSELELKSYFLKSSLRLPVGRSSERRLDLS